MSNKFLYITEEKDPKTGKPNGKWGVSPHDGPVEKYSNSYDDAKKYARNQGAKSVMVEILGPDGNYISHEEQL